MLTGTGVRSASDTPDRAVTTHASPSRFTESIRSSRAETVKSRSPSQRPTRSFGSAVARSGSADGASGGPAATTVASGRAAAERVVAGGAAAALLTRSSAVEGAGSLPRATRLSSIGRSLSSVASRKVPRSRVSLWSERRTAEASGVTKRSVSTPPVSSTTPATLLR